MSVCVCPCLNGKLWGSILVHIALLEMLSSGAEKLKNRHRYRKTHTHTHTHITPPTHTGSHTHTYRPLNTPALTHTNPHTHTHIPPPPHTHTLTHTPLSPQRTVSATHYMRVCESVL